MATETQRVGESGSDTTGYAFDGHIVQIALGIRLFEVPSGREELIPDGQGARDGLDTAGCSEQVSCHALGGRDFEFSGVITENGFDGLCLCRIIYRCRGAVGVDIIDVLRFEFCRLKRHLQGLDRPASIGVRCDQVIGIAGDPVSADLAVDISSSGQGMLEFFYDQYACALRHDKSVPVLVKGTAGLLGSVVVFGAESLEHTESSERGGRKGRLCAAGDDRIHQPVLDAVVGVANGVRSRGAGRGDGKGRTLSIHLDRDLAGSDVADHLRDKEGVDGLEVEIPPVVLDDLFLHGLQSADAVSEHDSEPVRIDILSGL